MHTPLEVGLFVAWLVVWLASALIQAALYLQIIDDVERDIPLDQRPSWRLLRVQRFPRNELRLHRQMYPDSQLRTWWFVAYFVACSVLTAPFVIAVARSFSRGS